MEIETETMTKVKKRPLSPAEEERRTRLMADVRAEYDKRIAEEDSEEEDEMVADFYAFQASRFRDSWNARNARWSGYFGSFEDRTEIPCMRFTEKKPEPHHKAIPRTTLQIFSVEVAGISGASQWPLHVYGTVFLRDKVDHKRNVIFERTRDNCQILTQEVPYLTLTGPTRAVVLVDPVTFEVDLKVKGTTESEDKDLSFLAVPFMCMTELDSCLVKRNYTSKLSTLEFALGVMVCSLEATIKVRVTGGSWPDCYRAQFAACTTSIDGEEVVLLDSGDDKVHVDGDGWISLSRRVATVEDYGELKVGVKASLGDEITVDKHCFTPKEAGTSDGTLDVGFCQMDVTVAWSLVSSV